MIITAITICAIAAIHSITALFVWINIKSKTKTESTKAISGMRIISLVSLLFMPVYLFISLINSINNISPGWINAISVFYHAVMLIASIYYWRENFKAVKLLLFGA